MSKKFLDCSYYACCTPLASLCQVIHRGQGDAVLKNAFHLLSDEMQQDIRRRWGSSPSSSNFSSEAGEEFLANQASFVKAIIAAIQGKWESFSVDQCNEVYAQVSILAEQLGEVADWGKPMRKRTSSARSMRWN